MRTMPEESSSSHRGVNIGARLAVAATLAGFSGGGANAQTPPPPYDINWSDDVGLWALPAEGMDHARGKNAESGQPVVDRYHEIRQQPRFLLAAALDGVLERIPVERVLRALRAAQDLSGGRWHGNFRWHAEDTRVVDPNSGFFTTLPLLALHFAYRDRLDESSAALLAEILRDAAVWFETKSATAHPRYPNATMGDYVCAWLTAEVVGEPSPELVDRLRRGAAYWRDQGWGWGEHLSDIYAKVCQDVIAALLLFARQLPEDVREAYRRLNDELAALDGRFAGGPRVPALRNYFFESSPARPPQGEIGWMVRTYRELQAPWVPTGTAPPAGGQALRGVLSAQGWAERVDRAVAPAGEAIPCFGGAMALNRVDGALRIGAMSRYPLMPDIDWRTWGLAWQSMPVAWWSVAGDWSFMEWRVREGEHELALPVDTRWDRPSRTLTTVANRSPVGQTRAVAAGEGFLVLRSLPETMPTWSAASDGWRWLAARGEATTNVGAGGWHTFAIAWPESEARPTELRGRTLVIAVHGLGRDIDPQWHDEGAVRRLAVPLDLVAGRQTLWWMSETGAAPPAIEHRGGAWRIAGQAVFPGFAEFVPE